MSGGSANVIVPYDREECIVIPQGGTYEIQNRIFAYKVVDGKAVSTPIRVFEVNDGKEYIVEDGLKAGDVTVITTEITIDKIGRSINCCSFIVSSPLF